MRSAKALILVADGAQIELAVNAERPGDHDLLFHHGIVLGAEKLRIQEVGDPNAAARRLVLVAGTDAARCGADGDAAFAALRHFLHHAVLRKQHVGAVTDEEIAGYFDARGLQSIDLAKQRGWVDDQTVSDHSFFSGTQDAARNQLEDEFFFADEDRVARVVSALIARDNIEPFGEEIDDFAFTLIAPLRAEDDYVSHFDQT